MSPRCQSCGRLLSAGDLAYADDWKVVDMFDGVTRVETRYTCEGCAA